MGASYVQDGGAIQYTPQAAVTAGDVVVQGALVGVARFDIAEGATGVLAVEGVYDLPKAAGASTAIAAGAQVYWDVADGLAKADDESGTNQLVGKAVLAAVDADTTVRVRLSQ